MENFSLALSQANNVTFPDSANSLTTSVTIIDDDAPTLSFITTDFNASEAVGNFEVEVQLSETPNNPVTFRVDTGALTANFVADYDWPSIRNYTTSTTDPVTILVPIIQDTSPEGNETFEIILTNLVGAVFASGESNLAQTITIIDDDTLLSFVTTDFSVAENINGGKFNVQVQLSKTPTNPVTFNVALSPDSAFFFFDYESLPKTSFSISNTDPVTIPVPIYNDRNREGTEQFFLTLSNLNNASFPNGGSTLKQAITIIDDEDTIVFVPHDRQQSVSVAETAGTVDLEFELIGESTKDVTVTFETRTESGSGKATADDDFIALTTKTNTATIRAGDLYGTIPITIIDDDVPEANETFTVNFVSATNADLSSFARRRFITVKILNDDPPELSISAVNPSIKEGANVTADFEVTLNAIPSELLTIHYLPESTFFLPDGISGNPQMTVQPLRFTQESDDDPIKAMFSIPLDNDILKEFNGTLTVTLLDDTSAVPKYVLHATNYVATMTIEDDDAKVPVLAITAPSGTPESAGSVEFIVTGYTDQTKSTRVSPERPITIQYMVEEVGTGDFLLDSIAGVSDSVSLEFSTSTFSAPLIVDLDDDSNIEATGKVKVTLKDDPETVATYTVSTGADKSAEATIWDDEAPELSIRGGNAVTEGTNTKAVFRVISNVMPKTPLAVQYTPIGASFYQ